MIGETTFTLASSAGFGLSSAINFQTRQYTNGISTVRKINKYVVDGVANSVFWDDTANLATGAAVNITLVPEPSAIGMLLLGSLGLVGFRRSAFRRLSA